MTLMTEQQIQEAKQVIQHNIMASLKGNGVEYFAEIQPVPHEKHSLDELTRVNIVINPVFYDTADRNLQKPKMVVQVTARVINITPFGPHSWQIKYSARVIEPNIPLASQIATHDCDDIPKHLVYFVLDAMYKYALFQNTPVILPPAHFKPR